MLARNSSDHLDHVLEHEVYDPNLSVSEAEHRVTEHIWDDTQDTFSHNSTSCKNISYTVTNSTAERNRVNRSKGY